MKTVLRALGDLCGRHGFGRARRSQSEKDSGKAAAGGGNIIINSQMVLASELYFISLADTGDRF